MQSNLLNNFSVSTVRALHMAKTCSVHLKI
jgi:hypothetical protein